MVNNPRILAIDDEPFIRMTFSAFLEDAGFRVLEAKDGREGISLFDQEKPDLVLCDLRMPEVDGLEVLNHIKKSHPEIPVVVVSGTGIIADAIEALRVGAWDYLIKPMDDMNVLIITIKRCLERAELLKENQRYKQKLEEMVWERTRELVKANSELQHTQLLVIQKLGKAAEYRDNETGRHVIRVSLYCKLVAQALGLEDEFVEKIALTSPLHDVGKIGVPDHILRKPGPLNPDEWVVMKEHTTYGADILANIRRADEREIAAFKKHTLIGAQLLEDETSPLMQFAARIANFHHEAWDGTGYPQGMKGEDIPLEARIVAVADIFDALSSKRPYKDPFPQEKCEEIIRSYRGNKLDPQVVDAFFQALDKILEIKHEWSDED